MTIALLLMVLFGIPSQPIGYWETTAPRRQEAPRVPLRPRPPFTGIRQS
jgi:hypothetical protein